MEASMAVLPLILDIVFVLIGVLIIWRCARNGFIKCLFKLVRTALALFLASLLVAPVAPVIAENFIEEPIYNYIHGEINALYENAEEELEIEELVNSIPEFLRTEDLEEKLEDLDGSGEELVESVSKTISDPVVEIVSTVIAFVVLFILFMIVLSILMALLNSLIEKIAIIHLVNTLLGLVWGVLVALIIWTLFAGVCGMFFDYESTVAIKFFVETNVLEKLGLLDLLEELISSAL